MKRARPHLLGIDDGPFEKRQREPVPIVGVLMEGADLIEAVVTTRFAVDGDAAADFLAGWISGLRLHPNLQGIVLGGITIAGLGVVDIQTLSNALGVPVLVVTRREPNDGPLQDALRSAGLEKRAAIVAQSAPASELQPGLWVAQAGATREAAHSLVRAALAKSKLPEPLRVAHLIARAFVTGESRGRA